MSSEPPFSRVVILIGATAAALEALQPAAEILESFGLGTRMAVMNMAGPVTGFPDGVCALIVASGNAALPAALATGTELPVIRVPTEDGVHRSLTLLSNDDGDLPGGPADGVFATMAIGQAGARNAALFVVSALAVRDEHLHAAWAEYRTRQTETVLRHPPLTLEN